MLYDSADANLLFGVLAFQNGFITRDQLIAGMQAWVENKRLPLDEHLLVAGAIRTDVRQLLQPLIAAHIKQHGDDVEKSLAAISSAREIKKDLAGITDEDLQRSLINVGQASPPVRGGTPDDGATTLSFGTSSSEGTRFHILRPHARGGLGEVFVARDNELGREVALKEIQLDKSHDAESRARFTREAEITGGLEHPGIVPVYGLGTYPDGRPFYAMRFIRGKSLQDAIKAYHGEKAGDGRQEERATEKNLELRRLLQRFIDVCEAINYAHSRGVLHRDLKPGNIMLGRYGETLVVDWGLARAGQQQGPDDRTRGVDEEPTLHPRSGDSSDTIDGQVFGTPAYMPPEQAQGRLELMGPRSDVYSLGATLYSILTGQAPMQGPDLLEKVRRGEIAPPRQVDPCIPRALAAICLKALSREPGDRYTSPGELAEEVERWLADEPVAAYRESMVSRIRRGLRKRPMVAGSMFTALLLGLAAALGGYVLVDYKNRQLSQANDDLRRAKKAAIGEAERADNNAQQANEERDRVRKTMTFLVEAFRKPDPDQDGRDVKVADLLLPAAQQAQVVFARDPLLQAELLNALWETLLRLGLIDQSLPLAEQAYQLRLKELGEKNQDTLVSMNNLGVAHLLARHPDQALPFFEKAREASAQGANLDLLRSLNNLGATHIAHGEYGQAIKLYEEARDGLKMFPKPAVMERITVQNNLGEALLSAGQTDQAIRLLDDTWKDAKGKLPADDTLTLVTMLNLAAAYRAQGDFLRALPLSEEGLKKLQAKLPPGHRDVLTSQGNLGLTYLGLGKTKAAVKLLEQNRRQTESKYGLDDPDTLKAMHNLGSAYVVADAAKALPLCEKTHALRQERLGAEHPDTLRSLGNLAAAHAALKDWNQAVARGQEAADKLSERLGSKHPDTQAAQKRLKDWRMNL